MKSQIAGLCGLATLASGLTTRPSMFARQDATCIDCTVPLVANSDFANGVVADGDYYNPTKTGNWLLAQTAGGTGDLSVVQDPAGNYLRNFCAKGRSAYCSVYLAQIVTVQAGVSYDFSAQYAVSGVRQKVNTVSVQLNSLDRRTRYLEEFTYTGDTDWTTFGTSEWVSPVSGDIFMTVIWRNDPNDAVVKYRSLKLEAVECRKPDSPLNCANQQSSTTTTSTAAATTTSDTTTSTTDSATTSTTDTATTSTTDSATTSTTASTTDSTTTSTTDSATTSTTASTTDSSATTATSTTDSSATSATSASTTSTQASTTLSTSIRRPGKCGRKTRTRLTASTKSEIASSTTAATSSTESEAVAPTTTTTSAAASSTVVQTMTVY